MGCLVIDDKNELRDKNNQKLKKFNHLTNDIIFIDGVWGSGKSLLGPIVSGMAEVEKNKIEHIYEYICTLSYLKKITPDATSCMLEIYSDLSQYNNLISREVNLRWSDDSGLANNPNFLKYIARLFKKDGDYVLDQINNRNIALSIMSHQILQVSGPLFKSYGERVKIIEMVRHPLYLISHFVSYLERFNSAREFTLACDFQGNKIPWFAADWAKEFTEANLYERAILSIIYLCHKTFNAYSKLGDEEKSQTMILSFEELVTDSEKSMMGLERFLGRKHHANVDKILRKQKIPRISLAGGRGHSGYGWSKNHHANDEIFCNSELQKLNLKCSLELRQKFMELILKYNKEYPSHLNKYI